MPKSHTFRDSSFRPISEGRSFAGTSVVNTQVSSVAVSTPAVAPAAELVHRGVWTFFNDQRAIYSAANDSIYFGYLDPGIAQAQAARYHITKQKVQTCAMVAASPGAGTDDHNNPVVAMLDNGKLIFGETGNCTARTGLLAGSLLLADNVAIDTGGIFHQYIHFFQAADTNKSLFAFYRFQDGVNPIRHSFNVSTDRGATWGSQIHLFQDDGGSTAHPPFFQIFKTAANRCDFLCTQSHPDTSQCDVFHFYMVVAADGSFKLYGSDDTEIGSYQADGTKVSGLDLPMGPASLSGACAASLVYDSTGDGRWAWVWDLCLVNGTLMGAYTTFANSAGVIRGFHRYYICTLSGGSWASSYVADGGSFFAAAVGHSLYPNADTTQITYSGGICLDPNNASLCYVSQKYGESDFRLEKWAKSGGTWAYSADISGNTGLKNFRPHWVDGYPTTQILYLAGNAAAANGGYTSYTTSNCGVWAYPGLTVSAYAAASKPASPAWQAGSAPAGVKDYWLMHEGSGAPANFAPGGADTTQVGTLTWGAGSYGQEISGWSTSNYLTADTQGTVLAGGTYPCWGAFMFKNSSASAGYLFSEGNSGGSGPIVAAVLNYNGTAQDTAVWTRDDGGSTPNALETTGQANDGNYHVLTFYMVSVNDIRYWLDGSEINQKTQTPGALTTNQFTIGVLRRNSVSAGTNFPGSIVAAAIGNGSHVDPFSLAYDWLSGTFSAVR